jgi:hypothetical protein
MAYGHGGRREGAGRPQGASRHRNLPAACGHDLAADLSERARRLAGHDSPDAGAPHAVPQRV